MASAVPEQHAGLAQRRELRGGAEAIGEHRGAVGDDGQCGGDHAQLPPAPRLDHHRAAADARRGDEHAGAVRHEEPQDIGERLLDRAHAGRVDQGVAADGEPRADRVEKSRARALACAVRDADGDDAAADERDAEKLDRRRVLVQQQDRAYCGEQRPRSARHRIDGGERRAFVGFDEQQLVDRMDERRAEQEPDRAPLRPAARRTAPARPAWPSTRRSGAAWRICRPRAWSAR